MIRRSVVLALALVLSGCSSASSPATSQAVSQAASPVQERMFRHFGLARDLRTHVVAGDLDRLSVTAEELARVEETWGMPPGSEPYEEDLRNAARRAADATDLDDATFAVAELAAVCGGCHLANDTDLGERFQTSAPYMDDPNIRHPNYLSWVSRLLWNGLVGPSERTWTTGAGALVGEGSYPPPAASHVPASENATAAATFDELGTLAVTADDVKTRADLVARVWATCADCHVQAGVLR